jgi:hypothetical protein
MLIIKQRDIDATDIASTAEQRIGRAFKAKLQQLTWNTAETVYFEGQRYNVIKWIMPDKNIGWLATLAK